MERRRIHIQGVVQGVGFRPFVYHLATELGIKGWVSNSAQGVWIDAEGIDLSSFLQRLDAEKPPHSLIRQFETELLPANGYTHFEIRHSDSHGDKTALILPDLATCPDCLQEIFDPTNRRYLYPFTNCTHCGPRFSIIEALPYDRPHTTMRHFELCEACRAEYENPLDRRFHAQPNACPQCGPHLELWDKQGNKVNTHHNALLDAGKALRQGQIVAVKGLGGFHLMADARNEKAVQALRSRKHRPDKPFALMYPSLANIKADCEVSPLEEKLLLSSQAPIVLLKRKKSAHILEWVAPHHLYLGVMLPYTPLHHLLMHELHFPIVATSGNLSDESICIDERDALKKLGAIADVFLIHNRPINRQVDDSIVRVVGGKPQILRRSRGYAPLPIEMKQDLPVILGVGAHLKNTVAVSSKNQVFISQHIGDLETEPAFKAFRQVIADFQNLYELKPQLVACDLHPDYLSSQYAKALNLPVVQVQHHEAHVLGCMAEHGLADSTLGIAWDGTGYGRDGVIWGGEFFHITPDVITRVAHLRPFGLPGGEKAIKEPRRTALGLLYEIFGDAAFELVAENFSANELRVLKTMLAKNINVPRTTSAGRLFDAVASILGLCQQVSYEGQAAVELEYAVGNTQTHLYYDFAISGKSRVMNWEQMIHGILGDLRQKTPVHLIAARFHNTLVEMMIKVTQQIGESTVVLSGGCFQNQYLTECAIRRLKEENFCPYWHERVPPNDGGIALGQVIAAARTEKCV